MRWTDRTRALVELSFPWSDGDARPSVETLLQDSLAEIMEANPDIVSDALFGRAELSWDIRHALSEGVKSLGRVVAFDLGFRRAAAFVTRMQDEMQVRYPTVMICDFGHIADGGVHFNFVAPQSDPLLAHFGALALLGDWVVDTAVIGYEASFSAEHGVGRKNEHWHDLYVPAIERELAERLIATLAPARPVATRFGTSQTVQASADVQNQGREVSK